MRVWFWDLSKIDLVFLGNNILGIEIEEASKHDMAADLIKLLFEAILDWENDNDLFWEIVDFFSKFVSVVK